MICHTGAGPERLGSESCKLATACVCIGGRVQGSFCAGGTAAATGVSCRFEFCGVRLPHRAYSQQSVSDAVTRTVPRDIVAAACPRIKTLAEVKHSLRPGCLDLPPNKRLSSKLKLPKSQASSAPNA
eukprot:scaffold88669_cov18-Tisochrysis_lutea.AAC.1